MYLARTGPVEPLREDAADPVSDVEEDEADNGNEVILRPRRVRVLQQMIYLRPNPRSVKSRVKRRACAAYLVCGLHEHGDGGEAPEGDGEDEEHGQAVEGDAGEDKERVRLAR